MGVVGGEGVAQGEGTGTYPHPSDLTSRTKRIVQIRNLQNQIQVLKERIIKWKGLQACHLRTVLQLGNQTMKTLIVHLLEYQSSHIELSCL